MTKDDVKTDKVFLTNSFQELPEIKMNNRRPSREVFHDWPAKEPLTLDGAPARQRRR
jgi:hypothetical protein